MFQQRSLRSVRSGFTLIELLVVIAIISLLAAILFPVFSRARENARKSACQNNMKQIGVGFLQYTQDYDEMFPQAWSAGQAVCWWEAIYPYVKSQQVFSCPSDSNRSINTFPAATTGEYHISYVVNFRVCGNGQYGSVIGAMADMPKPASTVLASDGGVTAQLVEPFVINTSVKATPWLLVDPTCSNGNTSKPCNDGGTATAPVATGGPRNSGDGNWAAPNARHLDTATLVFLDGHVKSLRNRSWYYDNSPWLNSAVGG